MLTTIRSAPQFASGWVSQPDGRGTLDIIWLCFSTIFVATWTVLHLNVPAPEESFGRVQIRKVKWLVAAIVVPEVVTVAAFAQRVAAKRELQLVQDLGYH